MQRERDEEQVADDQRRARAPGRGDRALRRPRAVALGSAAEPTAACGCVVVIAPPSLRCAVAARSIGASAPALRPRAPEVAIAQHPALQQGERDDDAEQDERDRGALRPS